MPLVKSVEIDIGVKGDTASKAKLDSISRKAEELKKAFPEYKLKIDSAAASERLKVFKEQLRSIPNETTTTVKVKVDSSALDKFSKSGFLAPSGLGIAAALSPALIPLAGGIAAGIGAIGASFGAAAVAAGGFGIVAKSVLASASSDSDKLLTVQTSRAAKLSQLQIQLGAATTGAQKKQIESQIATVKKASDLQTATIKAGWTQSYSNVVDSLTKIKATWKDTSRSIASPVLLPWLDAVNAGMGFLKPLVQPVAMEFQAWGVAIDRYFKSKAGSTEIHGMAVSFGQFASLQLADIVQFIRDVGSGIHSLGHDLSADGVYFGAFGDYLAKWGDEFANWAKSKQARGDVSGFLAYMHDNGGTVVSILRDLSKLLPGILAGASQTGTLELQAISGLLGGIAKLPKGWQQPLTEAAGAILLLSKTGVVSTGLKVAFPKEGAGKVALAASLGMRLVAGAFIVPAAVMIIGTIIPKDTSKQAAADFKNQPGIIVKVSDFLHTQGLGAWVDQYFSHPIRKWALTTLPDTLDTAASKVGVFLTKTIPTDALKMALSVTGTFGKLPGPLGAPFRKAHDAIATQLSQIQFKAAATARQINLDWQGLHGKKVALTFGLNLPAGVSFPSRHIKGHAAGTPGASPGWAWVGEKGPELMKFKGGEQVIPNHMATRIGGYAQGTVGDFTGNFPSSGTIGAAASAMQAAISSVGNAVKGLLHINKSAFTFAGGFAGPGGGSTSANAGLAHRLYASQLSPASWAAWNYVAMRESGWNQFARNPSSGAYGIAQALPPTKYPFAGQAAGGSNPTAQISWMWNYMAGRYGGPLGAAAHEQAFNWYDKGGWLMPGLTLAMNKTGRPEQILPPGAHGGGQRAVLELRASRGDRYGQFLLSEIQRLVTVNGGGDVQATFGQKA